MSGDRIISIDPAHFHAALIQREMPPGIDPTVHIFAPLGPDLVAHLNRLIGFNTGSQRPMAWQAEVHAGPDFLARMLRHPPGNIVVLAGRNRTKIDTMLACVDAGLHVLADKPWIIRHVDFPKLERLLALAEKRKVAVFDIMTERHEITSILQRELIHNAEIFGKLIFGSPALPAVTMESVHALKKTVAGAPLKRPPAFFDVHQQGEGLTDVGTHLVDLVAWMIAPNESIDVQRDIELISADRWPTLLKRDEYGQVTGESEFPPEIIGATRGEAFAYYCNNRLSYTLCGHHVSVDIRWDLELPAGDTHNAFFHGTRSRVEIRQRADRPGPAELYVIPNDDNALVALRQEVASWNKDGRGVELTAEGDAYRIVIPERLRIGHEAHFAKVTAEFLAYVRGQRSVPAWEAPNLLAKYFITTQGVELAKRAGSMVS